MKIGDVTLAKVTINDKSTRSNRRENESELKAIDQDIEISIDDTDKEKRFFDTIKELISKIKCNAEDLKFTDDGKIDSSCLYEKNEARSRYELVQ